MQAVNTTGHPVNGQKPLSVPARLSLVGPCSRGLPRGRRAGGLGHPVKVPHARKQNRGNIAQKSRPPPSEYNRPKLMFATAGYRCPDHSLEAPLSSNISLTFFPTVARKSANCDGFSVHRLPSSPLRCFSLIAHADA